jgi:predicted SnoaL-like aldol condensation-catalyzing enzyme
MNHDLKRNKQIALNFYKTAYEGNPRKAVELYVGDQYIQHNPDVKDGKEGFIEYFERMQREYPEKSINMSHPIFFYIAFSSDRSSDLALVFR